MAILLLVQMWPASPVTTQEALCAADVCAPVLRLDILDYECAIWQDLKTLSPGVD